MALAPLRTESIGAMDVIYLLQPCVPKHLQKLRLGSHVDRLRNKLAVAIIQKTLGNPKNPEQLVHFSYGVKQDRIAELALPNEGLYFARVFVTDGENHQPALFESPKDGLEIGHLLSAGRTPGGPEIHQHHLPGQALQSPELPLQVREREIGVLALLVVSFQFGHGICELRVI